MAMVCPHCGTATDQRLQCAACSVRLMVEEKHPQVPAVAWYVPVVRNHAVIPALRTSVLVWRFT